MSEGTSTERLEAFNDKLRQLGIFAYWMRGARESRAPDPTVLKWKTIYPLLLEAGEVVRLGGDAFRRNMAGYQIVMPGETAPAHRHTASAMRFVVVGDGSAYTTTNGEQMFMEAGDLLVQPSFGWHDHSNPVTGGHTLPSMSARIQMLRPGEVTRPHRHTCIVRYHVVQGDGTCVLDQDESKALEWEGHDSFEIPSWRWHQHRNRSKTQPAI